MMDHGKLAAANFTIDMTSITNTDIKDKGKSDYLVSHLKNEDFFDVEKFPKADFKMITASKLPNGKHKVIGELNIKNFKDVITFELDLTERNNTVCCFRKIFFRQNKIRHHLWFGNIFRQLR